LIQLYLPNYVLHFVRAMPNSIPRKYDLILCELHHPQIHGKTANSDTYIENHYLVYDRFDYCLNYDADSDYDTDYESESESESELSVNDYNDLRATIEMLSNYYSRSLYIMDTELVEHPTIRNFPNIVTRSSYIEPQIAECIELPTMETVAILKTMWLRIVQRKWKKICLERKRVISCRKNPINIRIREASGRWLPHCIHLPGLIGMLKELSK
jgi:hypothetical protein